jgi:hypothetical protein
MDDRKKGVSDKDVLVDPNDLEKKLRISHNLEENRNSRSLLFSEKISMSLYDRYRIWLGSLGR